MFAPQLNFHAPLPIAWSLQHSFRIMLRQMRNESSLGWRSNISLGDMTSLLQVEKNITAVMKFGILFEYFYRALSFIGKSFILSVHTHTQTQTCARIQCTNSHINTPRDITNTEKNKHAQCIQIYTHKHTRFISIALNMAGFAVGPHKCLAQF